MSYLLVKLLASFALSLAHPDETLLENVQQLTSPEMGFEKAGEAYFSPDGKKISFQAVPKGEKGYQIYTLDLETKEIVKISQNALNCTCSYFHPTDERILFAASPIDIATIGDKYKWDFTPYMNIYEANLDGSNLVQLTFGTAYHAECAYSPDGQKIVFASNESGSMNLYVMDRDGSNMRRLTATDHCYNGGPFFSPNGEKIIYRADPVEKDLLQIYVMDKDGKNCIQLTDNNAVNWAPFWLSDTIIAFTTSIHGHRNYEIYLLSLLTGNTFRVTHHPSFDGLPSFNKEGNKMLWTSKRGVDNTSQIYMADFKLPQGFDL